MKNVETIQSLTEEKEKMDKVLFFCSDLVHY